MEQISRKLWMDEAEASEYLEISRVSVHEYAMRGIIPSLARALPQRGPGKRRHMYEFSLEALDAYEKKRRDGNRRKGGAASGRIGEDVFVTDEEIGRYLDATTLTLAEIGRIAGISDERVRQIGNKLGVSDAKIRMRRRKERVAEERNQKRWDKFLNNRPSWHRAFQDQCDERAIVFKPYVCLRDTELFFSYHRALCSGSIVHLYYGAFRLFGGKTADYVLVNVHFVIPENHFVAAVGTRKEDGDEKFYFWLIPGFVVNAWREQHNGGLYLALPRCVRLRYGLAGYEDTRSPWAEWYDRWDLLTLAKSSPSPEP